jgi:hypothetical protein
MGTKCGSNNFFLLNRFINIIQVNNKFQYSELKISEAKSNSDLKHVWKHSANRVPLKFNFFI